MDYPPKFSAKARDAVEAAFIRAGRLHDERKQNWRSKWSFSDRESLAAYILGVFLVYAHEAIELGKSEAWAVDQVRRQALEGLRLITNRVSHQKNYHVFIDSGGYHISPDTQREFETTVEWRRFEDDLLAFAEGKAGSADKGTETAWTPRGWDEVRLNQYQRQAIVSAESDLDGTLRAHEQMREFISPGDWSLAGPISSTAPTMGEAIRKLERDLSKYAIRLIRIVAESIWGVGTVGSFCERLKTFSDDIHEYALSRIDRRDLPLFDERALESAVDAEVESWIRKARREFPPPWACASEAKQPLPTSPELPVGDILEEFTAADTALSGISASDPPDSGTEAVEDSSERPHCAEVIKAPALPGGAHPPQAHIAADSVAEPQPGGAGNSETNASLGISDSTRGIDGGAKPGLPKLSELTKRKLAIHWDALLDRHCLTGADIDRYTSAKDHIRRIAVSKASPTRTRWSDSWLQQHERAKTESGISPSAEAAKGRFAALSAEYWPLWESGGTRYESYAGQLDVLKRQVLAELKSLWQERSEAASRWFETACAPAVEQALAVLVREQISRAREVELGRLEHASGPRTVTTGNPLLDEIYSGADDLSPAAQRALDLVGLRREEVVPPTEWPSAARAPTQPEVPPPLADSDRWSANAATDAPQAPHLLANTPPQDEVRDEKPFDQTAAAKEGRAKTVAKVIRELDTLKPQMFEDQKLYDELRVQHPDFLAFKIAENRPDLKAKILAIRFSTRHIRLAQELAGAYHGRELSTIQDDWKDFKPPEFKRPK